MTRLIKTYIKEEKLCHAKKETCNIYWILEGLVASHWHFNKRIFYGRNFPSFKGLTSVLTKKNIYHWDCLPPPHLPRPWWTCISTLCSVISRVSENKPRNIWMKQTSSFAQPVVLSTLLHFILHEVQGLPVYPSLQSFLRETCRQTTAQRTASD